MKLFVDLGNTALKWAMDHELVAHQIHRETVNDLTATLDRAWGDLWPPSEVVIASVRHLELKQRLIRWVDQNWSSHVRVSQTQSAEMGITNGYDSPTQLGVDRWLAMLAAWDLVGSSVLVVDCGTATILDGLDDRGEHFGGLILPGVMGFSRCLFNNTDLSAAQDYGDIGFFATDTASAVQSGAILTHVCIIQEIYRKLQRVAKTPADVQCILTGGDASLLVPHLGISCQLIPDLVLQGLALQSRSSG
jgi:type III pantothenate kinase